MDKKSDWVTITSGSTAVGSWTDSVSIGTTTVYGGYTYPLGGNWAGTAISVPLGRLEPLPFVPSFAPVVPEPKRESKRVEIAGGRKLVKIDE